MSTPRQTKLMYFVMAINDETIQDLLSTCCNLPVCLNPCRRMQKDQFTVSFLIPLLSDLLALPVMDPGQRIVDNNRDDLPDGWLEQKYPKKAADDINEEGYTYLNVYLNSLVDQITEGQK